MKGEVQISRLRSGSRANFNQRWQAFDQRLVIPLGAHQLQIETVTPPEPDTIEVSAPAKRSRWTAISRPACAVQLFFLVGFVAPAKKTGVGNKTRVSCLLFGEKHLPERRWRRRHSSICPRSSSKTPTRNRLQTAAGAGRENRRPPGTFRRRGTSTVSGSGGVTVSICNWCAPSGITSLSIKCLPPSS